MGDLTYKKAGKLLTFTVNNTRLKVFFDNNDRLQRELVTDLDPHDETQLYALKTRIATSLQNDANFKKKLYTRLMARLSKQQVSKAHIDKATLDGVFTNANGNREMAYDALKKLF